MSSGGHVASSSGCATRPKAEEIGLTGYAEPTQHSSPIGRYVMATAEHREPCDSRGSCTVLGAPGGEIPPGDSTFASDRHAPAAHGLSASLRKRISERLPRYVRLVPTAAVSNRNKIRSYSSTSSARASNMGGTSMPSVLAVLTLMMSWYWVGTCTGRSAGFSPLSIRLM
jgi:hypothetical protein